MSWKDERNRLLELAYRVLALADHERKWIKGEDIAHRMELAGRENVSATQVVGRMIWETLEDILVCRIDDGELYKVEGVCNGIEHVWFEVHGDPELCADPGWVLIIDPAAPDVYPQGLLISPNSPFKLMYQAKSYDPELRL